MNYSTCESVRLPLSPADTTQVGKEGGRQNVGIERGESELNRIFNMLKTKRAAQVQISRLSYYMFGVAEQSEDGRSVERETLSENKTDKENQVFSAVDILTLILE